MIVAVHFVWPGKCKAAAVERVKPVHMLVENMQYFDGALRKRVVPAVHDFTRGRIDVDQGFAVIESPAVFLGMKFDTADTDAVDESSRRDLRWIWLYLVMGSERWNPDDEKTKQRNNFQALETLN